jgi:hypothetical protein
VQLADSGTVAVLVDEAAVVVRSAPHTDGDPFVHVTTRPDDEIVPVSAASRVCTKKRAEPIFRKISRAFLKEIQFRRRVGRAASDLGR